VFAGSFDLDAVEGVASERGDDALASLEPLVDRSLVSADRHSDQLAFRLLGPIRDFAAAGFERSGESNVIRQRHAQYYLDIVRGLAVAFESGDDLAAVAAIERAESELAAALEWSLSEGHAADGLEMAALLGDIGGAAAGSRRASDGSIGRWPCRLDRPRIAPSLPRRCTGRGCFTTTRGSRKWRAIASSRPCLSNGT
jgi:predicted ATPase